MSDNRRQYHTIRQSMKTCYPTEPTGRLARHLNTLAALVSGIVASQHTHLPKIAAKVPDAALVGSRVQRFRRFVENDWIDWELFYLPYALQVLDSLAHVPLFLVMDASAVGRGCAVLTLNVVYKQRALPLVWLVVRGPKGHFAAAHHCFLLDQLQPVLPEEAQVIFLGDGEFDSIELLQWLDTEGWTYVCRTAPNIRITHHDACFRLDTVDVAPGQCIGLSRAQFTGKGYGPVQVIAWWDKAYEAPVYLVTNVPHKRKACSWYRKRFHVETFFSDQKSRGFHLDKSHLSDPERLRRLMMGASLAYLWMIFLGCMALVDGWVGVLHRTDRCDYSLFQLGLQLRDFFLNEADALPVAFHPIPWDDDESVR